MVMFPVEYETPTLVRSRHLGCPNALENDECEEEGRNPGDRTDGGPDACPACGEWELFYNGNGEPGMMPEDAHCQVCGWDEGNQANPWDLGASLRELSKENVDE